MGERDDILGRLSDGGLEASFQVAGRRYRCFAYHSPGRGGASIRWRLYTEDENRDERVRGLTFGIAACLEQALADLFRAAEEHATSGGVGHVHGLSFRPSPRD